MAYKLPNEDFWRCSGCSQQTSDHQDHSGCRAKVHNPPAAASQEIERIASRTGIDANIVEIVLREYWRGA